MEISTSVSLDIKGNIILKSDNFEIVQSNKENFIDRVKDGLRSYKSFCGDAILENINEENTHNLVESFKDNNFRSNYQSERDSKNHKLYEFDGDRKLTVDIMTKKSSNNDENFLRNSDKLIQQFKCKLKIIKLKI